MIVNLRVTKMELEEQTVIGSSGQMIRQHKVSLNVVDKDGKPTFKGFAQITLEDTSAISLGDICELALAPVKELLDNPGFFEKPKAPCQSE